jgi:hypothetical protein
MNFQLALLRKLRLPLSQLPSICLCGRPIDPYGDHFFSCLRFSKLLLHNRVRDIFFQVLKNLAPLADLTCSKADVAREPPGLLPDYPTLRPADVALRLIPGAVPGHITHLLLDFTSIPMPSSTPSAASDDPFLSSVVKHHEVYENGKFACRSGRPREYPLPDVPGALLAKPFALIPITFDPGGQFGPLASRLFWESKHIPPAALPATRDVSLRHRTGLSAPSPNALADIAVSSSLVGLLDRANRGWHKLYNDAWFTRHYEATSPSQWATQVIGQNLLLGLSNHLRNAISASDPFGGPSLPSLPLACAQANPRLSGAVSVSLGTAFFVSPDLPSRALAV